MSQEENAATPQRRADPVELWGRITRVLKTNKTSEIARIAGVSASSVSDWKYGRTTPSVEVLLDIADYGDTTVEWLLQESTTMVDPGDPTYFELGWMPKPLQRTIRSLGGAEKPHQIDLVVRLIEEALRQRQEGEVSIYLGPKEHEIIQKLAGSKKSFEDEARDLILEALKTRGLVTDQVDESNLIFFGDYVPKMVEMDLLGEIAAGEPLHVFTDREPVQVPQDFIKRGKSYFVLRVTGESMIEDGIRDGALIVCESKKTAKTGDTVVAMIDGDKATVKRYYPERGRIRLQPANELHSPIFITDERIEIQGIVVGIFHRPQQ